MDKSPSFEQVVASLSNTPRAHARAVVVLCAQTELFDAASRMLEWVHANVHPDQRPISLYNRLLVAINGVQESHQMEPPGKGR